MTSAEIGVAIPSCAKKLCRRSSIPRTFCLGPRVSREDNVLKRPIEKPMSMITASLWVPRGAAAAFPEKYDVDEDELARISKLAKLQLEDAKEDLSDAKNGRRGETETEDSDADESGMKTQQSQV